MWGSAIVFLAAALLGSLRVEATPLTLSHPKPSRKALPLTVSSNVLTLTSLNSENNRRSAASILGLAKIPTSEHVTTLTSLLSGQEFVTEITFGTEKFIAIVDTGSSDTWMVEQGFQCINENSVPEPESVCNFGPTYNLSNTFVQITDINFNITYGGGEFLNGIFGREEVTLAGLKVQAIVAAVDYAAWSSGNGVSSGLIGLAYPAE